MSPAVAPLVELEDLTFSYGPGSFSLTVPALAIEPGRHVACIGPSGTGKTTLVHLMVGIESPDSGTVRLGGTTLASLSEGERRAKRLSEVGMVFQEFELLEYLSALDNVLLPYRLSPRLRLDREVRERAHELARTAGIDHVLARPPRRLSQGERQRVALCRALVTEPSLIVCDEPTGNLDPRTAKAILDLLFSQAEARGATLVMVTHDHSILGRFDEVIDMAELAGDAPG